MPIPANPTELASLQRGRDPYKGPGSVAKNEQLRSDEKDVHQQVEKIRSCTESNWKVTQTWREKGEESYRFVENDQWDEKDKAYMASPEGGRRPTITLNKILPQVRLLSGMERQNREELRVFPREGSDTKDADMMTGLVKYTLDENLAPWQFTRKSNDVYICGRGWIKTDISYDENINGDPILRRLNPFQVFWDTLSDNWDGSDFKWIQDAPWLTEEEARELWHEFEDQIRVGDWLSGNVPQLASSFQSGDRHWNDKLFLDKETRRVRLLEHWYKERHTVNLMVNTSTGDVQNTEEAGFEDEFMALSEQQRAAFQVVRRKVSCVRVASVLHWLIVQDKPSPFKHNMLPIVPYIGIQFMGEPFGLVEPQKDPQRLFNKGISNVLHHHNRSTNSGWLNQEDEGASTAELQKFGSAAGTVINYKTVKPERIEPARLDSAHMAVAQLADTAIGEISLLNAEIQGISTQRTVSGKAIEARQRGGMIGNEDFFDNQLLGDKVLGYQLISNIQYCYTPARIQRVLGSQAIRNPNDMTAQAFQQLQAGNTDELFKVIDRCLKAEYDYVVDRKAQSVTIRQEQFRDLLQAAKDFPGSIPPDVIVDLSEYPEDIKARIKAYLQQQQQMQQSLAMMKGGARPQGMPQ
jgi:hypothetical protein